MLLFLAGGFPKLILNTGCGYCLPFACFIGVIGLPARRHISCVRGEFQRAKLLGKAIVFGFKRQRSVGKIIAVEWRLLVID